MRKTLFVGLSLEFIKMVLLWLVLMAIIILCVFKFVVDPAQVSSDREALMRSVEYSEVNGLETTLKLESYESFIVLKGNEVVESVYELTDISDENRYTIMNKDYFNVNDKKYSVLHKWYQEPYDIYLVADAENLKRDAIFKLEFPIESRHLIDEKKVRIVENFVNIMLITVPVLLIFCCALLLAKKFQKSFKSLSYGVEKIRDGHYDVELESGNYKELDDLYSEFNDLAKKLSLKEKENLELSESKKKMLLDISHDLRTPSSTIQGYAKALKDGMVTDTETQKKYLNYIYTKSKHVTDCINVLFDYARIEHDMETFDFESVDVYQLLREILISYIEIIEDQDMKLEVDIPEEPLEWMLDRVAFKRCINNLLDNAIKYNEAGMTISVKARFDSQLIIEVIDDGIGIDESIEGILFDPMVRGDSSRTDGGLGIGLSITREIITKLKGEIKLVRAEKGAHFLINLFSS